MPSLMFTNHLTKTRVWTRILLSFHHHLVDLRVLISRAPLPAVLSKCPVLTILKACSQITVILLLLFALVEAQIRSVSYKPLEPFPSASLGSVFMFHHSELQNCLFSHFVAVLLGLPLSLVRLLMKPISVPFFSQHLLTAAWKLIKGQRKKCGRRKTRRDERTYNCHRHPA